MDHFEKVVNRIESEEDRQFIIHTAKRFYKLYGDIFRGLPLIPREGSKAA
jgi:GTP cyclohydrolase I